MDDAPGGAGPDPDAAVAVVGLVKRYPRRDANAVDGLSFTVHSGEVFGLLGPNGAGKTTTVGVLTTMVRASAGQVHVAGVDVRRDPVRARAALAVVPQQSNLDRSLTPRQNLEFHAAYHGVARGPRRERAIELLGELGLAGRADDRVDWYSGGMAQRLMIARALMHTPKVLFLDEPTTGLDLQSRLFVWDRIRTLRHKGVTVVLTTHDMDEAAQLSDRVGIIDHGRLIALDTPERLIHGLDGRFTLDLATQMPSGRGLADVADCLTSIPGVDRVDAAPADPGATGPPGPGELRVRLHTSVEPASLIAAVVAKLIARQISVTDVRIARSSLENVFIALTGRGLR